MHQKRLDVPFELQETNYLCGPTTLSLVARYCGLAHSQRALETLAETDPDRGTACAGMAAAARSIGLWAYESWHGTVDDLRALIDLEIPPIIYVYESEAIDYGNGDLDHFHFYIVTGYDADSFFVHDTDPAIDGGAAHKRISRADLVALWRSEPGTSGAWLLACAQKPHDDRWLGPRFDGTPIAH